MPVKLTQSEFINKAKEIHNNIKIKYTYDKVIYINYVTKVIITCLIHGDFEQKPRDHIYSKAGCQKCKADKSRLLKNFSQEDFISRCIKKHGNRYDYSLSNYINANTKVQIVCRLHGSFWQVAMSHMNGYNCPKCGDEEVARKLSMTREEFIKRAVEIHGEEYTYEKVIYKNNNTPVIINCQIHGDFLQKPGCHIIQKHGCHQCYKDTLMTIEDFKIRANEIHNEEYDYSLITSLSGKVPIICREHGVFYQKVSGHINQESGCFACYGNKKYTIHEILNMFRSKFGNKFEYDFSNYTNIHGKIIVICPIHKETMQSPNKHLNSQSGCYKCSSTYKSNTEDFIKKAKLVHKNPSYDYSLSEYIGSTEKIKIKCYKHGEFLQIAHDHLDGHGCIKCSIHSSHKEQKWLDSLNIATLIPQHPIKHNGKIIFYVDSFDPITDTAYEFDGNFWHGNPEIYKSTDINNVNNKTFGELYQNTLYKREKLKELGYKVISIWESEWDRMQEELKTQHINNEAA